MLKLLHQPFCLHSSRAMLTLVLLFSFLFHSRAETTSEITKPILHDPRDIARALRACFNNLPMQERYHGMRITIRIAFNRKGEIIGKPQFTYITPDAAQQLRESYKQAMLGSLGRCTPFSFAPELGDAFAGQPFFVRFIENK
jgi:hypothetical protein